MLYVFSQSKSSIAISQDSSIALIAPAVALAASAAPDSAEAKLATALAVLGTATILSGVLMALIRAPSIARVFKLIPYSVSVGFLASSGWLLLSAAILLASDASGFEGVSHALGQADHQMVIVPAVALGLALFAFSTGPRGAINVLWLISGGFVAFYVGLWATGIGVAEARQYSWLPLLHDEQLTVSAIFGLYGAIDWASVGLVSLTIAGAALVNLVSCTMNHSGLELVIDETINPDREVQISGFANIGIGAIGGPAAFSSIASSSIVARLNAGNNELHIAYLAVILLGLLFASTIVAFTPAFVSAGFLLYIGIGLINDWLIKTYRQLPLSEWLIALAIVLVTVFFGILFALVAGLAFAVLLFVATCTAIPIIRLKSDGSALRSAVERSITDAQALKEHGSETLILALQGYLFFGTADRLLSALETEGGRSPKFLILSFKDVLGIDASSCAGLAKLMIVAERRDIRVVLAHLSQRQRAILSRWHLDTPNGALSYVAPDLDDGLKWCEDEVLSGDRPVEDSLISEGAIRDLFENADEWFDTINVTSGTKIIEVGATSGDLYFLAKGQLSIWVEGATDKRILVGKLRAGSFVGEMAFVTQQPRSADVVAETDCRVLHLSEAALARLEQDEPQAAVELFKLIARNLAYSVQNTNALVRQLAI